MGEKLKKMDRKLFLFTLIGIFVGIILFAGTAGSMSATDTGEFCSSCHVMESHFDTFASSNHATLTCNDCHAPREGTASKMTFKAKAGLGHIYANTIGANNIPDVLHATADSQEVINDNCISCHGPSLENISHDAKDSCIDCHRQVPHNKGDFRPAEWYEPREFFFQSRN